MSVLTTTMATAGSTLVGIATNVQSVLTGITRWNVPREEKQGDVRPGQVDALARQQDASRTLSLSHCRLSVGVYPSLLLCVVKAWVTDEAKK